MFDLAMEEGRERIASMPGTQTIEPGFFDNFAVGTGKVAMRGFAQAARALDLAAGAPALAINQLTGNYEGTDRFFREHHDPLFQRPVDYWTPKPGEVGLASEVVGSLLSTLPLVIANPAAGIMQFGLSQGQEAVQKGASGAQGAGVATTMGAGFGMGVWLPILGQNLWQRMLLGGAGFNVAQGVAMRAAAGKITEGTPAAEMFKALDPSELTIDALLGLAFGGLVHRSPAGRAQGEQAMRGIRATYDRLTAWARDLPPSAIDALATLRMAQHKNVDSIGGRPEGPEDVDAHVRRVNRALEQAANDQPIEVQDLPAAKIEPYLDESAQVEEANRALREMEETAEQVMREEGIVMPSEPGPGSTKTGSIAPAPEVMAEIDRGHAAARRVLSEKVDVPAAVQSQEHGPVTLVYGTPGTGKKLRGGFGLSHIIAKHGEDVVAPVIETVVRGSVIREQRPKGADPRVLLTHDGHTAVLSLKRDGADETWLLTGWREEGRPGGTGEGDDSSGPTSADPTLTRAGGGAGRDGNIARDAPGIDLPPERKATRATLLADIKGMGGINRDALADITGEQRTGKGVKGLPPGVFVPQAKNASGQVTKGRGLDDLATMLRDKGWPIPDDDVDGGVQVLRDLIADELAGKPALRVDEDPNSLKPAEEQDAATIFDRYAALEERLAEEHDFAPTAEYQAAVGRLRTQRDYELAAALSGEGRHFEAEARRSAAAAPDLEVIVGENADGTPIKKTARDMLDDAERQARDIEQDEPLMIEAAECMIGVG